MSLPRVPLDPPPVVEAFQDRLSTIVVFLISLYLVLGGIGACLAPVVSAPPSRTGWLCETIGVGDDCWRAP